MFQGVLWGDLAAPPSISVPRDAVDGPRARLEPQLIGNSKVVFPAVPASDIAGDLPVSDSLDARGV